MKLHLVHCLVLVVIVSQSSRGFAVTFLKHYFHFRTNTIAFSFFSFRFKMFDLESLFDGTN
jgi:hypothetical protein